MNRRRFLISAGALGTSVALPALGASPLPVVQVFKSPTCGCCGAWVAHMKTAGFSLRVAEVHDAEVKRLLATRPRALGLAVPGMPQSAPGMDVPGRKDPYQVLLVDASGQSSVFADYPK
jgi:hypothetical protein